MAAYERLLPCLKVIVDEALAQGFRVFVTNKDDPYREIDTARVCLDFEGSFAEVGTWRLFGYEPILSVPITPKAAYGYAGKEPVEPGATLASLIEALRTACLSSTVTLRHQNVTVPNYGKSCLKTGGSYPEGFVEIADDGSDKPVKL